MSLTLWLPHVKPFSVSLHSVPLYKGGGRREGEYDSKWLTRVNILFLSLLWKEALHFWILSFLHYEGKQRKSGEI